MPGGGGRMPGCGGPRIPWGCMGGPLIPGCMLRPVEDKCCDSSVTVRSPVVLSCYNTFPLNKILTILPLLLPPLQPFKVMRFNSYCQKVLQFPHDAVHSLV